MLTARTPPLTAQAAGLGGVAGQGERAGAGLHQRAAAADRAGVGQGVGVLKTRAAPLLTLMLGLAMASPLVPLPICSVPPLTWVLPV